MAGGAGYHQQEEQKWLIKETDFNQHNSGKYESLFSLGNGYMGLRAATEEHYFNESRGYFAAGVFDQFPGEVTELVNLPDWLGMEIIIAGETFNLLKGRILAYTRKLNLKKGLLSREVDWESPAGRISRLSFSRFISLADLHSGGLKVMIKAVNYTGNVTIKTGFDGRVTNSGVQHLIEGEKRVLANQHYYLTAVTQQSGIMLAVGAGHNYYYKGRKIELKPEVTSSRRRLFLSVQHQLEEKSEFVLEKVINLYTSRDPEFKDEIIGEQSQKTLKDKKQLVVGALAKELEEKVKQGYDNLLRQHQEKWTALWNRMEIKIDGPDFDQLALRFAQFHLIQMAPAHDSRLSIAAKGLSGEGYKGHVFWDAEIFDLPFFCCTFPQVAKNLLIYRYHTLAGARQKAAANGYRGAMYAWESALTGEEVTPTWSQVDPLTGKPIRIWSGQIEQHITADVAKAVWDYFQFNGDRDFIERYGAEIILETARFWADRLEYNQQLDKYEINDIIGPDEYGEHVNNNAYTNYLVHWHLARAVEVGNRLKAVNPALWNSLCRKIKLTGKETAGWQEKLHKIYLPYDPATDIIVQYDGFLEKKELDLTPFKGGKGEIINRIGWQEVTRSRVIKQADVVMLLNQLPDQFSLEIKKKNYDFYQPLTLHDSSLSPAVHAIVAADIGEREQAYQYFQKACRIDLGEDMKSSDQGLHAASLGGIWQAVVFGFGGLRVKQGKLTIIPRLPRQWKSLQFNFYWQGREYQADINGEGVIVRDTAENRVTAEGVSVVVE